MLLNSQVVCLLLFFKTVLSGFSNQPRIETDNGHLYLFGAENKNISLRTSGQGTVNVNGQNLGVVVQEAKKAVVQMSRIKEAFSSLDLTEFRTQLSEMSNRLRLLEGNMTYPSGGSRQPSPALYRSLSRRVVKVERRLRLLRRSLNRNECRSDPCKNGGSCLDLYNGYFCQCTDGWEGKSCEQDVNECARFAGTDLGCQNSATCRNKPGSYECQCTTGWYGIHCTKRTNDCSSGSNFDMCGHGTCVSQTTGLKGFTCICDQGWKSDGVTAACMTDVDECEKSPCSANPPVQCHNRPGTFYCGPCPPGYTGSGFACYDVDECQSNNGGCSVQPLVTCINTVGSSQCGPCPPGYQGDGKSCIFVGKCNVDNGGCHPLAMCREVGTLVQCTCRSGYAGLGVGPYGCQPSSDPVVGSPCEPNPCSNGGQCIVSNSTYTCFCLLGYSGPTCQTPRSKCLTNPCKNGGTCVQRRSQQVCQCPPSFQGRFCQNERLSCGGLLTEDEGLLQYPPLGTGGARLSNCGWLIRVNSTKVINITFEEFDLTPECNCRDCEYLQIYDGPSHGDRIIGRFCGSSFPNNGTIISSTQGLYLWWKSNGVTSTRKGFRIRWIITDPVCGGVTYSATHGALESPGSPGPYPPKRDCQWTIIAPLGQRLTFTFFKLDIETSSNCSADFLDVRDGETQSGHLLGHYCGSESPPPLTTASNAAHIYFHSDEKNNGFGFQAAYHVVPGIPGCGGLLTSREGEINPPRQDGNYLKNMDCVWVIRQPFGLTVQVTFKAFELESGDNCYTDVLELRDGGDESAPLLGRFCGVELPPTFTSSANTLYIKFKSDHSVQRNGFRISYKSVCAVVYREPFGEVKSPGYPEKYRSNEDCSFIIEQPPGRVITLTFQNIDMENYDSKSCFYDYVVVRDGHDSRSPFLGKFCTQGSPPVIVSTHNYLYLQFHSDRDREHRGFLANYSTTDVSCGGIYTSTNGVIETPFSSSVDGYPADHVCRWVLATTPGNVIQLTFTKFKLEKFEGCSLDYVEVYDNSSMRFRASNLLMGRFCGDKIPPVLTSAQNIMTVIFKSDFSVTGEGFLAHYHAANSSKVCGGQYVSEYGYLKSPNFPNNYPNTMSCVWIIKTKYGRRITLRSSTFALESVRHTNDECIFDYLEVRDGSSESSPLVGKFCGSRGPDRLTSQSSNLYLKFVSDNSHNFKGFRLIWDSSLAGCGGALSGYSGSIISPNYPEPYGAESDCRYKITVAEGSRVKLSIMDLETECRFDYVKVYDGTDENSRLLANLCNSANAPASLTSSTNQMFILFRSDINSHFKGFYLKYTTECNTLQTGYRGVIESPNFPEMFSNTLDCTWVIEAPKGNKINITFSDYAVESLNCDDVLIKIREGPEGEPPSNDLGRYCMDTTPPHIASTMQRVYVNFAISDFTARGRFRLEWIVNGCGGSFTKPYGTIHSPNYPDHYPSDTVCQWTITLDPESSVQLIIHQASFEKSSECRFDSLTVFGGGDMSAPVLTTLCHSEEQRVQVESSGNQMTLLFKSDSSNEGSGFSASYASIPAKCGGNLKTSQGSVHSSNYPKNYNPQEDCIWHIQVDATHRVNLTFVDFDLQSNLNCTDTYVEVYDGASTYSNLLARECGNQLPAVRSVFSSSNIMTVRFRASATNSETAKGFLANFTLACGTVIEATEPGSILVNDNLNFQQLEVNCSWTIISPQPDGHITLTLSLMDISPPQLQYNECEMNSIIVYDGHDSNATALGRYCGVKTPLPLVSKGNTLTLMLNSITRHRTYFQATYSTFSSACGGDLKSKMGSFASPGYPRTYPPNTACVWTLQAAPGNSMQLSFSVFDVSTSDNCNEDYVEVREGDGGGLLIGVFCGNTIPSNLTAAKSLWVKFRSTAAGDSNGQGFAADYSLVNENELSGTLGQIASPSYPRPFVQFTDDPITWRITVAFGSQIQLSFKAFHIDRGYDAERCISSLRIYDGYDTTAPLLKSLCGVLLPESLTTSSNVAFLSLDSHPTRYGTLFLIDWTQIHKLDTYVQLPTTGASRCGNNIFLTGNETRSADITSPGYPNGYATYLNCIWYIEAPEGEHLELMVNAMNIYASENCLVESLKVFTTEDGSNTWTQLGNLCSSNDTMFLSGNNRLKLEFKTNWETKRPGFNVTVQRVCGGLIKKSSGVIEFNWITPVLIRTWHRAGWTCQWIITVSPGRQIVANFTEFNVAAYQDGTCKEKFVILRNGGSPDAPLLGSGQYCGSLPLLPPTTLNKLLIKIKTSYMTSSFRLEFAEKPHGCGGRLRIENDGTKHVISSPNYPNVPPPNVECIWTFMGPAGKSLQIDFLDRFDLTSTDNCMVDYVELRDGATANSEEIDRFCSQKPSTQRTRSNMLYVKYYTNATDMKNGFKARVSLAQCGGILFASNGVIKSPGYPNSYPYNTACKWEIETEPRFRVSLKFSDIDLPPRPRPLYYFNRPRESYFRTHSPRRRPMARVQDQISYNCSSMDTVVVSEPTPDQGPAFNMSSLTRLMTLLRKYYSPFMISRMMRFENPIAAACNNSEVSEISSTGHKILVSFVGGDPIPGGNYRGFKMSFTTIEGACEETLNTPTGIIMSPKYPNEQPSYYYCNWKIVVPADRRVSLEVLDLDLTGSTMEQRLSFYNDHTFRSRIAAISSNSTLSPSYKSSSNKMMVNFWSSSFSGGGHRGFKLKYTSDEPAVCGGTISNAAGIFQSPANQTSFFCLWQFSYPSTSNQSIILRVTNAQIGNRPACSREYGSILLISSPDDTDFSAELCGKIADSTIRSPYTRLFVTAVQSTWFGNVTFEVAYFFSPCGGVLEIDEETEIVSPGYYSSPQRYPPSTDCAWIVKGTTQLTLTVVDLDLQPGCSDSLTIKNGGSYTSPVLGTLCGTSLALQKFPSEGTALYIEFQADDKTQGRGFRLKVAPTDEACRKVIHTPGAEFQTPNFPNSYGDNQECVWEIHSVPGTYVSLEFRDRFHLEDSPNCTNDFVKIYDYVSGDWELKTTLCGRHLPEPIVSKSTKMKIWFRSNGAVSGDGFLAKWIQKCGGTFTAERGSIISPNYPNNYLNDVNCQYNINPGSSKVSLTFRTMEIEPDYFGSCEYDYIEIFASKMWKTELTSEGKFCGSQLPQPLSLLPPIQIVFKSDAFTVSRGFLIDYEYQGCGGYINQSQVIQYHRSGEDMTYTTEECVWDIVAPEDKTISIRMTEFNLFASTLCEPGGLRGYSGLSSNRNATLIGKACGDLNSNLPVLRSGSNTMHLKLRKYMPSSNEALGFTGFVFFTPVCGSDIELKSNPATVMTPDNDGDGLYDSSASCIWTIRAAPDHIIRIYILRFDVDNCNTNSSLSSTCNCDYVQLQEGMGHLNNVLLKACGTMLPTTLTSSTSVVTLTFVSDAIYNKQGFAITFSSELTPCGHSLLTAQDEVQIIQTPNYPGHYPPNTRCRWTIATNSSLGSYSRDTIHVHIDDWDIEDSANCGEDYLAIEDSGHTGVVYSSGDSREISRNYSEGNPQIIRGISNLRYLYDMTHPYGSSKFCGSGKGIDFYSSSGELIVKFESNAENVGRGFKLEYSIAGCTRNYSSDQGRIKHQRLTPGSHCYLKITAPMPNQTIAIYHSVFYLGAGMTSGDSCEDSFLEVRDGNNVQGDLLGKYCGFNRPNPSFSTSSSLWLHLHLAATAQKFMDIDITYTTTDKGRGCGGRIYNTAGSFSSPLYPNNVRSISHCSWDVSVPLGSYIVLWFAAFDLGPANTCETDYLEVFEVKEDIGRTLRTKLCGGDLPAQIKGTSNHFVIEYKTSQHNGGTGWHAKFTSALPSQLKD